MGGPYNIPRDYKGENKILFIFSMKSFMYTAIGGIIGVLLYYVFSLISLTPVGVACIIIFALLGFALGTFKVPETNGFEITKKTGGEPIDQVILRWIKFKAGKNRIYVYKEGVHKDE